MKKYFILGLFLLMIIMFIIFLYFYSVWGKEENREEQMVNLAFKEVPILKTVEEIEYFAGNQQVYFITGKDKIDMPLLIWITDNQVYSKSLSKWVTKEEIKAKALKISSNITIKRITRGLDANGKLIYEVLFRDEDERLGYIFFDMENGDFIQMYRLGKTKIG